jgi:proline dehydrogenase
MPGETADDALATASKLKEQNLGTAFTFLGEVVTDPAESQRVTEHYLGVLDRIRSHGLGTEISVKLTQMGLDLDPELCYANLVKLIEHVGAGSVVWIDMESSDYMDVTLNLFRRAHSTYPSVGVCLQAYLYRTEDDLASLIPLSPAVRLVKGAYKEPQEKAFPQKAQVDEDFFKLATQMLGSQARAARVRAAFAIHDHALIKRITDYARSQNLSQSGFEFQMLCGIQSQEQLRLAREGWK